MIFWQDHIFQRFLLSPRLGTSSFDTKVTEILDTPPSPKEDSFDKIQLK